MSTEHTIPEPETLPGQGRRALPYDETREVRLLLARPWDWRPRHAEGSR